ncbi:hypothetical protein EDB89DRAFT_1903768 [Lactarius sanguifluus]|nr:hypothetical protein EDB89DRAFT_1903768 [Lactarius sanguifluus]
MAVVVVVVVVITSELLRSQRSGRRESTETADSCQVLKLGWVFGVEDEVGVDEIDAGLVVVDKEVVGLIELVEVVLNVGKLDGELEIEEDDDELEAIKLETEESCGKGVDEEEGLGDGAEEVLPRIHGEREVAVKENDRHERDDSRDRAPQGTAPNIDIDRSAFEELNQDVEMIEAEGTKMTTWTTCLLGS